MFHTARARIVSGVVFTLAILAFATPSYAQTAGDGPTSLILSYRARPDMRVRFRHYIETAGIRQFETWKSQHVYRSYTILFSSYASATSDDMYVVLNFAKYSDTADWMTIEKTMPGGLAPAALDMAVVQTSNLADDLVSAKAGNAESSGSIYMILPYDVTVDASHYAAYVKTYVEPQFRGWLKLGVLSSYSLYINQSPAGAAWSSLLLLEYKNISALGRREIAKDKVRASLRQTDPAWKAMSEQKTSIRKEGAGIIAAPITLAKN